MTTSTQFRPNPFTFNPISQTQIPSRKSTITHAKRNKPFFKSHKSTKPFIQFARFAASNLHHVLPSPYNTIIHHLASGDGSDGGGIRWTPFSGGGGGGGRRRRVTKNSQFWVFLGLGLGFVCCLGFLGFKDEVKDEVRKMVDSGVKAVGIGMGRRRQRSRRGLAEHQESSGGQMAGPEPVTPPNKGTTSQNTTKDIIEWHLSALKELLKEPSNRNLIKPMLQDFDGIEDVSDDEVQDDVKGKEKVGHRMPTNVRIYDGTSDPEDHMGRFVGIGGEWTMPVWCRMFQQTLDGKARAWFDKLPPGSIDNWDSLQEKFLNRFRMLKACDKDPTKILKIARRANETLPHFKKTWVSESNAIPNVPELMQMSSFMSSHKCPELVKRFSDSVATILQNFSATLHISNQIIFFRNIISLAGVLTPVRAIKDLLLPLPVAFAQE
ncbi:reverse transcriptase domain-containing protein [Tanacetum coccineum]